MIQFLPYGHRWAGLRTESGTFEIFNMITQAVGWRAEDGSFHATEELAMIHTLCELLKPKIGINNQAEDIARLLVKERATILSALQVKTDPKFKVRKTRSDKGKRKNYAPPQTQTS